MKILSEESFEISPNCDSNTCVLLFMKLLARNLSHDFHKKYEKGDFYLSKILKASSLSCRIKYKNLAYDLFRDETFKLFTLNQSVSI